MYVFRTLCILLVINVISATIPRNEININPVVELESGGKLPTENGYWMKNIDPTVIFGQLIHFTSGNNIWKYLMLAHIKVISRKENVDAIRQAEVKHEIAELERDSRDIQDTLTAISIHSESMNYYYHYTVAPSIQYDLEKIIVKLANRDSLFGKYPTQAIPHFMRLAEILPKIENTRHVSCKLKDILHEYHQLARQERLSAVHVSPLYTNNKQNIEKHSLFRNFDSVLRFEIENTPFQQIGEISSNSDIINCMRECPDDSYFKYLNPQLRYWEKEPHYEINFCIIDTNENKKYYAGPTLTASMQ